MLKQAPQSHAQVSDAGTSSYVRRLTADTTLASLSPPTPLRGDVTHQKDSFWIEILRLERFKL